MMGDRRLRRGEWTALAVALIWSAGLMIAAALAPAYQSTTETSSGTVTHESATLVDENGPAVLLPVGMPLLVTVIVGYALWRREASRGAGPVAWTFTGLLAGFNVVAMLSIGPFIVPVTASLFVACAMRQAPTHGARQRSLADLASHDRRATTGVVKQADRGDRGRFGRHHERQPETR